MAHADGINNRDHNGDMAEEEDGLVYVWLRRTIPSEGLLLYYTLNWLLEDRLYTVMCRALRALDTIGFSTGWIGPICPRPACTCVREEELIPPRQKRAPGDLAGRTRAAAAWSVFALMATCSIFSVYVLHECNSVTCGDEIKSMSCLHCFTVDGKKFYVQLCHPAQRTPSLAAKHNATTVQGSGVLLPRMSCSFLLYVHHCEKKMPNL